MEGEEYQDSLVVYRPVLSETLGQGYLKKFSVNETKSYSRIIYTDKEAGDAGLFRFVPATETTYYIQNKASGMYLSCNAENQIVLSATTPFTFNVESIGCGACVINCFYISGEAKDQLYADPTTNTLVTSAAKSLGSNAMMFIEETEETGDVSVPSSIEVKMWPGALYAYTFPTDVTFDDNVEVFDAAGFEFDEESNKNQVILGKAASNTVTAGTPVIVRTKSEFKKSYASALEYLLEAKQEEAGCEINRAEIKTITEDFDAANYETVTVTVGGNYISQLPEPSSMLTGSFGTVTVPQNTTSVIVGDNAVKPGSADAFGAFIAVPTEDIVSEKSWRWKIGTPVITIISEPYSTKAQQPNVVKFIEDGRVVIVKDGVKFDLTGRKI